jgi:acyl-CoA thioester hydrolase
MARDGYWIHVFGSERQLRDDIILARAELDYRAQAAQDHDLNVAIRVSRIGNSSFEFRYEVIQQDTDILVAEGSSVQVMFDYVNNRKIPIPEAVRQRMLEFEGSKNIISGGPDGGT